MYEETDTRPSDASPEPPQGATTGEAPEGTAEGTAKKRMFGLPTALAPYGPISLVALSWSPSAR